LKAIAEEKHSADGNELRARDSNNNATKTGTASVH